MKIAGKWKYMKKLHLILMLLVLASAGLFRLLNPASAQAAENSQAEKYRLAIVSGPRAGQVTVSWNDVATVDNFHIVYGTAPDKMQYGALNIGKVKNYTVKSLVPGTKYYFALVPVFDNMALYTTKSVAGVAMSSVVTAQVVQKTVQAPVVLKATAAPANKHNLKAFAGPGIRQVTLTWKDAETVDNYHLVYGTSGTKMQYGALDIGRTGKYTVKGLVPGTKYYFALVPVFDNQALYTTQTISAYAKGAVEVIATTAEAVRQPQPVATVKPVVKLQEQIVTPAVTGASQSTEPTVPAGI